MIYLFQMTGVDFNWVLLGFAQNTKYIHTWFDSIHPYSRSPIRTGFDPNDEDVTAVKIAQKNKNSRVCFGNALIGFGGRIPLQ